MKIVIIITWTPLPWSRSSLTFPFRIWGRSQFEWYRMWREWTCENFCENLHKVSCLRYSQFGSKLLELTSFDVGFYNHKNRDIKSLCTKARGFPAQVRILPAAPCWELVYFWGIHTFPASAPWAEHAQTGHIPSKSRVRVDLNFS